MAGLRRHMAPILPEKVVADNHRLVKRKLSSGGYKMSEPRPNTSQGGWAYPALGRANGCPCGGGQVPVEKQEFTSLRVRMELHWYEPSEVNDKGDENPTSAAHTLRPQAFSMTPNRRQKKAAMGALPPKYSFVLNPHAEYRATSCPRCKAKTMLRKIPLVIHVDGVGLLILRKTCRLCLQCETVIAHQAEVESAIRATTGQADTPPEYLVLGTAGPQVWRRGLSGDVSIDELVRNMADFKSHLHIEYEPGGWYPPS